MLRVRRGKRYKVTVDSKVFERGLTVIIFVFGLLGFCNQFFRGITDMFWVFVVFMGAALIAVTFKRKE
jgi:hypothetical protein